MKNIDTYQQGCLQTESMPETLVDNGRQAIALSIVLADISKLGAQADIVKKHLFYKKPSPEISAMVQPHREEWTEMRGLSPQIVRILHCILGVQSELEELTKPVYDHIIEGKPLDDVNLMEEMGDMAWYLSIGLDAAGFTFSDALHRNREKLQKRRFKKGYSDNAALNRDLDSERAALETAQSTAASESLLVAELLAHDAILGLNIDKKANKVTVTTKDTEAMEIVPYGDKTLVEVLAGIHAQFSDTSVPNPF